MKSKIAFILPGYGDNGSEEEYQKIGGYFQATGIKPIYLNIQWKRRVMSDYVKQFLEEYEKYQAEEIYLLGFSLGAMVCFIASSELDIKVQILCSLSPWFAEDLPYIRSWWREALGKNRIMDFKRIKASELAKKIRCKTIILAGSKEDKEVQVSNSKIYKLLWGEKDYQVIDGPKHDIKDLDYQKKIAEVINNLI